MLSLYQLTNEAFASLADFKALTLFAAHQCSRLCIVGERLGVSIPLDRASKSLRNIAQVAGGHTSMLAFHVRNGSITSFDAIKEISHVVDDGV